MVASRGSARRGPTSPPRPHTVPPPQPLPVVPASRVGTASSCADGADAPGSPGRGVPGARRVSPPLAFDEHALEVFAWARRIPRSWQRDVVYTFLFNTALAIGFTVYAMLFTPSRSWTAIAWSNLVICHCIGYTIHIEFALAERLIGDRYRQWSFAPRAAFFGTVPILGVIAGYAIAYSLLDWDGGKRSLYSPAGITAVVMLSLVISGVVALILSARERAARSEAAFAAERERVAIAERSAALARLKALEAQVEPHFLYNTLAHVAASIDREPGVARRMLDRLIELLRASAVAGTSGGSTLGDQVAHARAYLEIVSLRMGSRLAWTINVSDALATRPVPPAILQPLVENAVKHGVEPELAGGMVAIDAHEERGSLVLTVADTGAGFGFGNPIGGSTGVGLANLRARLDALYRGRAQLTLAQNAPAGVRATVRIPVEGTDD